MSESYQIDLGSSPRCRECGTTLPDAAVLCVKCGTDQRSGSRVKVAVEALPRKSAGKPSGPAPAKKKTREPFGDVCAQCGYDLTTLPGKPCPECGGLKRANAARAQRRKEGLRRYWRTTILTGSIAGVAGTAAAVALLMDRGASSVQAVVSVGTTIACAEAAYFGMCLIWYGFEETLLGSAIRLLGAGAVWAMLWALIPPSTSMIGYSSFLMVSFAVLCVAWPMRMLLGREWWECVATAGVAAAARLLLSGFLHI